MSVSIVVTSYNYAEFLPGCLSSCFDQHGLAREPEIVVVDDGSTDSTLEVLKPLHRRYDLRVIVTGGNLGVASAANIGIWAATRPHVVRVDADDYVSRTLLQRLLGALDRQPDALGVACDYNVVSQAGRFLRRLSAREQPISCGILYRRDRLLAAGLYAPGLRHCEEEELRRRLGAGYTVDYLREPLYNYRLHGRNKSLQADYESFREEIGLTGEPALAIT